MLIEGGGSSSYLPTPTKVLRRLCRSEEANGSGTALCLYLGRILIEGRNIIRGVGRLIVE